MTNSLLHFYGSLPRVKTVENVKKGGAMKDFLKVMTVAIPMLALFIGVRFAAFMPLHNETMAVTVPAPTAVVNGGCATQQVKTPCSQHTDERS
jgi:hypothetical protein